MAFEDDPSAGWGPFREHGPGIAPEPVRTPRRRRPQGIPGNARAQYEQSFAIVASEPQPDVFGVEGGAGVPLLRA